MDSNLVENYLFIERETTNGNKLKTSGLYEPRKETVKTGQNINRKLVSYTPEEGS